MSNSCHRSDVAGTNALGRARLRMQDLGQWRDSQMLGRRWTGNGYALRSTGELGNPEIDGVQHVQA